jgi:glycerol-3-phosphate dehydrogenase
MNRDQMLRALTASADPWDLIIIGGGATGLGAAVDAAARGYRTLLLEQGDFAKGTSSRSTKLIHGGVRYLQQGNLKLVRESLRERGLLTRNAPHLVNHLAFVVPNYTWWEGPFYGAGLKIYDRLAGKLGLGPSRHLSRKATLDCLPTLEPKGLRGGTIYFDGQFDDARLAIALAQTAADLGGTVINYMQVTALLKKPVSPATKSSGDRRQARARGRLADSPQSAEAISGVVARDIETGHEYRLAARGVINATGIFTDAIRRLDEPGAAAVIAPSQGAHIVLDRSFLPGDSAIMVPKTDDRRVLFAIPWHERVLIGTTETTVSKPALEPRPLREEIEFLLKHAARYLTKDPKPKDVLSAFAGLRPLVKHGKTRNTALVPRDHTIMVSEAGLVTITGGKWTTYRKMAEDTVDCAADVAGLEKRTCNTADLRLHGADGGEQRTETAAARSELKAHILRTYGSDGAAVLGLIDSQPALNERLHPDLPYRVAEVIWAVRHEMARTVEDVLSRRTRLLLLDARASMEISPRVARWIAQEIGRDEKWERQQVAAYRSLAEGYLVTDRK